MEFDKDDYYSVKDIANKTRAFVGYVLRRWWLLALAVLVGCGLGAVYHTTQRPKYEAASTFILEEKQTGTGGLGSIASQFGIDIGGLSGGGSIFTGDNILDILQSKRILQKILLSRVDSAAVDSSSLADLYLHFSRMREGWKNRQDLAQINFAKAFPLNSVQDSVLNIIYDRLTTRHLTVNRTNKRGTIIRVQVAAENGLFAKLLTTRLIDEASKMYLNVKIGTALSNINRLQRRSDSLLALLNNKSFTVASVQTLDANPGLKTLVVPVEIATRDKTVLATLYTEVTKNLETSKILLSQQTPVIQILDSPGLSLYDNKKSLFFLIVVGGFVSVVACLALVSAAYFLRSTPK